MSGSYAGRSSKDRANNNYGSIESHSNAAEEDEQPDVLPLPPVDKANSGPGNGSGNLHRGLSTRQVQMIAIAGTIGTGLFLGTGSSLARGGPASMLICYTIIGFIVYVTLLLLGEMATQHPIAGSFVTYCTRFFSPSFGFALGWNYWFNDAVSVAGDLVALQLVISFWTDWHPWAIGIIFWVFLVGINAVHVKAYGELEYWLASLKVIAIVIFIIIGILVNVGVNSEHRYIGGENWQIPGAPFVGGIGGFARVFVTASFAYGGTESLGITAGETRNPSKNMPRVVKFVFWRILIFYVVSILLIGLNVPYTYPDLANRSTVTSPFTIVFREVGAVGAGSFMNTVVLTSVVSAGNHALFAGTRVLYGLSATKQGPKLFTRTTKNGVPIFSLLATSSISILCFGSSFIGNGVIWGWLQNIVGVSNQISWFSIGLASWRFRKAWIKQGRSMDEMKFRARWTWPWGPYFVVIAVAFLIIVQGWSSIFPTFQLVDFISFYIQIPVMLIMYILWMLIKRPRARGSSHEPSISTRPRGWLYTDTVNIDTVDLRLDEYVDQEEDRVEDETRKQRIRVGWSRVLWRIYYWIA